MSTYTLKLTSIAWRKMLGHLNLDQFDALFVPDVDAGPNTQFDAAKNLLLTGQSQNAPWKLDPVRKKVGGLVLGTVTFKKAPDPLWPVVLDCDLICSNKSLANVSTIIDGLSPVVKVVPGGGDVVDGVLQAVKTIIDAIDKSEYRDDMAGRTTWLFDTAVSEARSSSPSMGLHQPALRVGAAC